VADSPPDADWRWRAGASGPRKPSRRSFSAARREAISGRTISDADDRPNAPLVAVLSHECWQRRFAGDPTVIGRRVQFNDRPAEIIGVMPAGFAFVYQENELWTAYRLDRNERFRETQGTIRLGARTSQGRKNDR
jgi:hypothetical protein